MLLRGFDEEDIKIILIGVSLKKILPYQDGGIDGEVFGNYYENKNAKGNEYTHTGLFWYAGDGFQQAYDEIRKGLDNEMFVFGFKYPHIDWNKAFAPAKLRLGGVSYLGMKPAEDGVGYQSASVYENVVIDGSFAPYGAIGKTWAYPSISKGEEGKLNVSYELQDEVDRALKLSASASVEEIYEEINVSYDHGYVGLVLPTPVAMRIFKEIVYGANMGIERSDGGEVYRNAYIKDFNVGFNFLGGIYEEPKMTDVATLKAIRELSPFLVK